MPKTVEVFADILCPFTHVGLRRLASAVADLDDGPQVVVRAWPLEWVNGEPLDREGVVAKARTLREQLGIDAFGRLPSADAWPTTTLPALQLAAAALAADPAAGLAASLAIRDAVFEEGLDISDPAVVADIAERVGVAVPDAAASAAVEADYAEGQRRGVRGSPDFWVGEDEFFCPSLKISRDASGLSTEFDDTGFEAFLQRLGD